MRVKGGRWPKRFEGAACPSTQNHWRQSIVDLLGVADKERRNVDSDRMCG